jgi:hypothetical protein
MLQTLPSFVLTATRDLALLSGARDAFALQLLLVRRLLLMFSSACMQYTSLQMILHLWS